MNEIKTFRRGFKTQTAAEEIAALEKKIIELDKRISSLGRWWHDEINASADKDRKIAELENRLGEFLKRWPNGLGDKAMP